MKNSSKFVLPLVILFIAGAILLLMYGVGENQHFNINRIRQGLDLQGGVSILFEADVVNPTAQDMAAANDMLRTRLDQRNYMEATTVTEGQGQIRVDIPGVEAPQAAINEIGASAVLMFTDNAGVVRLDGSHIQRATQTTQQNAAGIPEVVVALDFTSEGSTLFASVTSELSQRSFPDNQLLIWMDDDLLSSPTVSFPITGGAATITGQFSVASASLLASQINQGSLPFALNVISYSVVGARLGTDALSTSVIAGIIGLILVLIFMTLYYKSMGIAADIALIVYVLAFLLIISLLELTLTLPGIAGLILSIGMATDANIVIFERIREEVAIGKTLRSSIRTGYARGLSAIIDSNVTTLIAGGVLFWMGTGPIMGFAQMLIIGILLSMVTSIFITRNITLALMSFGFIKSSHILNAKQREAIIAAQGREVVVEPEEKPFIQNRFKYIAFSGTIIAIGIAVAVFNQASGRGFFNLDVEFSGGTAFEITTNQPMDNAEMENMVRQITGESAPQVQQFSNANGTGVMIRTTQEGEAMSREIMAVFAERFNLDEDAFTYASVSPAVGEAMRRSAIISIVLASIGMLLYISIRFRDLRKGVSAVIALLHDAAVVLCVYAILRIPLNYAFIAVMLTTIGYSINATIIIFDRIRENRIRMPKLTDTSLVNISVTQTLRRTIFSTISSFAAVLMLYIIGVAAVRDFTLPIMVGLLFGAYSSVCLSGSVWFMLKGKRSESEAE